MDQVSFDSFHFNPGITAGIHLLGYNAPSPIQAQVIPLVLMGKDIIGLAPSGDDKTAAFALPILQRLSSGRRGGTRALIITPTPEAAEQAWELIRRLGSKTGLQFIAIYGDSGTTRQDKELRNSPDIVIGCPGRLLKYLWKGTFNLSSLEILVIDEADRMSGLGLLPDVFNILMSLPARRQTLLFSSAMPDNLKRLSHQFLTDPVSVQANSHVQADIALKKPPPLPQKNKTALLKEILSKIKNESVLVFTRTRDSAERVARQAAKAGYRVTPLQGAFSEQPPDTPLKGFTGGPITILIVTDVKSRGIDVSSVFRIINYEAPEGTVDDAHRVGRTGKTDKQGNALTFVTSASTVNIHALELVLKAPLEPMTLE